MESSKKSFNFWLLIILAIPFIYLAVIWHQIPETVATHFDISGKADGFGDKSSLILIIALLMIPTYLILLLTPIIDPKKRIQTMGSAYDKITFVIMIMLSALALFIIHSGVSGNDSDPRIVFAIISLFLMALGNYFPTIKPNYFMGIRTPWTLENETVWRKTHRMGGRIFMIGGLVVAILCLLLSKQFAFGIFMSFTVLSSLFLLLYSYLEFKKL